MTPALLALAAVALVAAALGLSVTRQRAAR
jgi:hypothetical protein